MNLHLSSMRCRSEFVMIDPQHLLHIFRQRLKKLLCCALVEGGRLPFIVLCTIRPRLRRRCRPLAAATAALPLILQAGGYVVIDSAAMQLKLLGGVPLP